MHRYDHVTPLLNDLYYIGSVFLS